MVVSPLIHCFGSGTMCSAQNPVDFDPARQLEIVRRAIAKRSFCVLATSSAGNRPHAVGIMYAAVGLDLYLLTREDSVKVRNIRENPHVAVCIPVRKYPMGPSMAVQFQGIAEIFSPQDPHIRALLAAGRLKKIAPLGATGKPGVCVLKVTARRRISSYGLGMSLFRLMRDLSLGARSVDLAQVETATG